MNIILIFVIGTIGALFASFLFKFLVRFHFLCLLVLLVSSLANAGACIVAVGAVGFWTGGVYGLVSIGLLVRSWNCLRLMVRRIPYRYVRESTATFIGVATIPFLVIFIGLASFSAQGGEGFGWISLSILWLMALGVVGLANETIDVLKKLEKKIESIAFLNYPGLVNYVIDKKILDKNDDDKEKIEQLELLRYAVDRMVEKRELLAIELGGVEYLFKTSFWNELNSNIRKLFEGGGRLGATEFYRLLSEKLPLPSDTIDELVERIEDPVSKFDFDDGPYFVASENRSKVRVCSSCGLACWVEDGDDDNTEGEYFCSDICAETSRICEKLSAEMQNRKIADFATRAASLGVTVQGNAYFWGRNLKMVSPNARGPHGFAAEDANTYIDRIKGHNASVIGDDNAKSGADRLVDGSLIQTKYCKTGVDSVNAGFGKDGIYKYVDSNGKPMQLEVPKDQWAEAVRQMEKKIAEGKVQGVTDPAKAKEIVRQGNITYEQAVAITKFGTVESLLFDASRGAVVGVAAGGISFVISTALTYWRTKDMNVAIQSSVVIAAKSGSVAFLSYIGSQQLQRLPQVNAFLDSAININFGAHGKFVKRIGDGLYKMGGGQGKYGKKANATVKSAAVVAAVTFAITSSWEMVKLARGRISGWQCWKNIVQGAGGITGGTIGALIGGALLSPIPVVGTLAGSLIGGMVGGMAGSAGAKAVMDQFGEDDSAEIIRIISHQVEYLTRLFCLNESEIEEVSSLVDTELATRSGFIEDVYSHSGVRRQFVNSVVQPLFVRVVSKRSIVKNESLQSQSIVKALTIDSGK